MMKKTLRITGMTCAHCAETVRAALEQVQGVQRARVHFPEGRAEVELQEAVADEALIEAVQKAGYGAEVVPQAPEVYVPHKDAYDLCIVGGGSAAFAAAIRATELGASRVLIAEERLIGGTCLNRGCVPSKYLIETANALHAARTSAIPSVHPEGGRLDFAEVVRIKNELLTALRKEKYWDVLKAYPGMEYVEGHAEFAGADAITIAGRQVRFAKAVIATGSHPTVPPIPGIEDVPYLTSDTIFDLSELPEHLIILGGGAIGLELGQAFLRMGARVSIVEALAEIAMAEEPELRRRLRARLEEEGMEIHTDTRAEAVARDGGHIRLVVSQAGKRIAITGTHLLVATGRRPNTERLGLVRAGVETDERGFLKLNAFLQTTNPDVYGAGDCAGGPLLVTAAAWEGGAAAENALLGHRRRRDAEAVPHAIFTDPELAAVGLTEEAARRRGMAVEVRTLELARVPRAMLAFRTEGMVKIVAEKETHKVLGVHVLAPHAAEVIHRAVPIIKLGLALEDLVEMVDVYPTLAEGIKLCAQTFFKDVTKLSCCAQ